MEPYFWKKKKLEEFNSEEWDAVCSGCGKCCVKKIQLGSKVYFTNIACKYLDLHSCRCKIYKNRLKRETCAKVDYVLLRREPELLPDGCAYKLLLERKELPDWHPLVTGNHKSTQASGKSLLSYAPVRGFLINPLKVKIIGIEIAK